MAHYVYPQFYYPTPYMSPFYNQTPISPFVPPVAPLPPSPRPAERRVRFEDDYRRERRPSWHGGLQPPPNPAPFPSPPIYVTPLPPVVALPAQAPPPPAYTHARRHSDTCLPQPAWVTVPVTMPAMLQPVPFAPPTPAPQIHPLLNGESAAGPKILFDLSFHTFQPQRVATYSQTAGTPLALADLLEPATHPPVYQMTLTCDLLPEWPIVLERRASPSSPAGAPYLGVPQADAPITVYDVLMALYRTVQRRIAQQDWARLTTRQTNAVGAAYTRRCRTFPSADAFEAAQGVRRVDYLLDNYMFRGIARAQGGGPGAEGLTRMKVLVGPASR